MCGTNPGAPGAYALSIAFAAYASAGSSVSAGSDASRCDPRHERIHCATTPAVTSAGSLGDAVFPNAVEAGGV